VEFGGVFDALGDEVWDSFEVFIVFRLESHQVSSSLLRNLHVFPSNSFTFPKNHHKFPQTSNLFPTNMIDYRIILSKIITSFASLFHTFPLLSSLIFAHFLSFSA
jgi:hypothetical protein